MRPRLSLSAIFLLTSILIFACYQDTDDASLTKSLPSDIASQSQQDQNKNKQDPPEAFTDPFLFKIVEEMPLFGECQDKECSDKALIDYLYSNLKYPNEARDAKIEGRIYLQFIVEKDGSISNIHPVRSIGGGCDEAAIAVVSGINQLKNGFKPGMQDGQPVKVLYTLPITFKLE